MIQKPHTPGRSSNSSIPFNCGMSEIEDDEIQQRAGPGKGQMCMGDGDLAFPFSRHPYNHPVDSPDYFRHEAPAL